MNLGALMQNAGAEQLHNDRFADHQITAGGMLTRRLNVQTGFLNFADHRIGNLKCQRLTYFVQHRKAVRPKGRHCIFDKIREAHKIGTKRIFLGLPWCIFKEMGVLGADKAAITPLHNIGCAVNVVNGGAAENNNHFVVVVGMYGGIGVIGDVKANIRIFPGGGWVILDCQTNLFRHLRNEEGILRRQNDQPLSS